jgi:copper resistance protein D
MTGVYFLNVTLHVLAALLWLGGMFFFAVVGAPVLRRVDSPALRAHLYRELGSRFRTVGWAAIVVLVLTGLLNLQLRGLLRWEVLGSGPFWATPYGHSLAWKLGAVGAMIGISAYHDFVSGPAATRLEPGSADGARARRSAAWLGRMNAVIGIIVVVAAVRLARGG